MTLDTRAGHVPQAEHHELPPISPGGWSCGRLNAPWHCVWTKPRQEHIAARELEAAGFPVFFPLYGARRAEYVPMFRRYGFAQPNEDGQWVMMLHTRGVANLIRNPLGTPKIVPQRAINDLFAQCSPNGVIYEPDPRLPRKGEAVRVLEGPLTGFSGICARTSTERVWLLLTLLGRQTEVGFTHKAVEAAGA
jgi:transcriptional antiterminator RfaH